MKDLVIGNKFGNTGIYVVGYIVIVTAATPKKRLPLFHLKKNILIRNSEIGRFCVSQRTCNNENRFWGILAIMDKQGNS